MNTTRQDGWTKDEDIILAEIVLRYIREGRTQLEAFKDVAKQLSRTSAACGFRWNATIRKQYRNAIEYAKEERKQGSLESTVSCIEGETDLEKDPLDTAILFLKKMKFNTVQNNDTSQKEQSLLITQLKEENKYLKKQLTRYNDAWGEMGKLWGWINQEDYE